MPSSNLLQTVQRGASVVVSAVAIICVISMSLIFCNII